MTRQQQAERLQRLCDNLNILLERPTKMRDESGMANIGHISLGRSVQEPHEYSVHEVTSVSGVMTELFAGPMKYRECLRVLKAANKALELDILRRQRKAGV
jgi:hypothetical protein